MLLCPTWITTGTRPAAALTVASATSMRSAVESKGTLPGAAANIESGRALGDDRVDDGLDAGQVDCAVGTERGEGRGHQTAQGKGR
jgi:hypothetical protein